MKLSIVKTGCITIIATVLVITLLSCSGEITPENNANQSTPENDQSTSSDDPVINFIDGTIETGVYFSHTPSRSDDRYMPEIMGSGVAIADFNRDGAPDMFFVNSGNLQANQRPVNARNKLYLNNGSGEFTNASDTWNVPSAGYGMGVAAGDYDNDGWVDLYLTTFAGSNMLLKNTGEGFVNITEEAGLGGETEWCTSAAFFDLENDGDLDLYIARYIDYKIATALKCYLNERHVYCTPMLFDAVPDRLWRNNGDGTFTDISEELGINKLMGKGLAVLAGDIDADGDTDLYIANDSTRNFLFANDGNGGLEEIGGMSGVAYSEEGREEAGMGVDLSDADADGRLDITCTNFQGETTSLYQQMKPLVFREVSDAVGIGRSARSVLSFGVDFFDIDNDGDEDMLIANGHIDDRIDEFSSSVTFAQLNSFYLNDGTGRFKNISNDAGESLQLRNVSRGLATADLNCDGLLDYVITNNDGPATIALNKSENTGNWLKLWLEGKNSNRSAIGIRITAMIGERTLQRQILGSSSYLSVCDFTIHLGIGDVDSVTELTIYWSGGEIQTITDLKASKYYHIVEGNEPIEYVPGEAVIKP